jgi:2-dehydropantoate 2-reductase
MSKPLHVTILGMGSLGQLYAGSLAKVSDQILGLSRQGAVNQVRLMNANGVETIPLNPNYPDKFELLVVTTKAYQAVDAVKAHARRIGPNTTILLLHNGMGSLAPLRMRFPDTTIWLGTSSHGALLEHGILRHTGKGDTWIGLGYGDDDHERQMIATELFHSALPNAAFCDDIESKLWLKLAINSIINPLTAVNQCRNGELSSSRFSAQIHRLCEEFALLAIAEGIDLSKEFIQQTVYQVIDKTAANFSSMNRDIANKRPTENDQISGYVVSRAAHFGIPVATHSQLFQTICRLERG